jgi:hypothetical protein
MKPKQRDLKLKDVLELERGERRETKSGELRTCFRELWRHFLE